ncbi:MAG TPA: PIG-L family deacetylase [Paraburkholderia sp.]|nr:PIG-L family deacetylase [Paraburkholderia sp.]
MDENRMPCFVVSPHLDDAVFSCGMLLATHPGSVVCTVFAGEPPTPQVTPWDSAAGFADSHEAMHTRWREDHRALALCGAHAVHLGFLDSQYASLPDPADLVDGIADAWRQSGIPLLVVPLGLYHSDHLATAEACRLLLHRRLRARGQAACIAYEDALYRTRRGIVAAKRESLAHARVHTHRLEDGALGPCSSGAAAATKRRAVRAYRTQLRALQDPYPYDLAEPERFWWMAAV